MRERRVRRVAGLLRARLPELDLEGVLDPRAREGRWSLAQILRTTLLGLMAGCRSLAEAEALSDTLAPAMRRRLGLPRRLADTTARDALCRVSLEGLRGVLHRAVRAAWRRKALASESLPIQVVALDGKVTAVPTLNHPLVQNRVDEQAVPYGLVRTVTCALVSAAGRPCIDAIPIPAATNEMGHFRTAFASLVETYPRLFDVVTYDAGALSEPGQWLQLVRCHWGVENNNHHTLDTAFAEDARPWIEADAQGMLAVLLLRRIAYTLLALYRAVTLRSDDGRATPWKRLMQSVRDVLVAATEEQVAGLEAAAAR